MEDEFIMRKVPVGALEHCKDRHLFLSVLMQGVGLSKSDTSVYGDILYILEYEKSKKRGYLPEDIQYQLTALNLERGGEYSKPSKAYIVRCLKKLRDIGFVERKSGRYNIFEFDTLSNAYRLNFESKIKSFVDNHKRLLKLYNEKFEFPINLRNFYNVMNKKDERER